MKRGCLRGLLLGTVIAVAQVPTAIAGVRQDIRFQRGASSATIQHTVIRGERDRYTLGVGKGQYLSVKIESLEDNAVFDVYSPGANDSDEFDIKGVQLPGAVEKKSFMTELPANGKYLIVVGGTRGNAEYKLTVSVTNRPQPQEITPVKSAPPEQAIASEPSSTVTTLLTPAGGWRCKETDGTSHLMINYPDGQFLIYLQMQSLGDVLMSGTYSLESQLYVRTIKADRVGSRPWSQAAKATTVIASNYKTEQYKIVSLSTTRMVLRQFKVTNWDGRDSQNTNLEVSCDRADNLLQMYTPLKAQVPKGLL